MSKKELYAAPETEVLELRLDGNVLQAVSGIDTFTDSNEEGDGFIVG